jgi:N-acetylglucosamine-6-phosphate deacetylase
MNLVLRGAAVVGSGVVSALDVGVEGGRIAGLGRGLAVTGSGETIDVSGCTVAPGFVDAQINGALGIDVTTQPQRIAELGRRLAVFGVTSFLPTVVTCADRTRQRAIEAFAGYRHDGGAEAIGLHLEGPMLSLTRRGAHPPEHLQLPSLELIDDWYPERGVRLVTLAPELPGAIPVIEALVGRGVVVAAGHTDATLDELRAAVDAGLTMVTHLYNAMRPFAHRDPGPIGAALTDERLAAGLICDGVHVHPAAVDLAWRALGPQRTVLVTDAVAVMGSETGGGTGHRTATGVRRADGVLAGTDLSMDVAVRNLVAFTGCSLAAAARAASTNPARVLGLHDRGVIEAGRRADLVVLEPNGRVRLTIVAGRLVPT